MSNLFLINKLIFKNMKTVLTLATLALSISTASFATDEHKQDEKHQSNAGQEQTAEGEEANQAK
jgi:hypothetical protein